MSDLKPCLFCGSNCIGALQSQCSTGCHSGAAVECDNCMAHGPLIEDVDALVEGQENPDVVAAWNRRADGWVSVEAARMTLTSLDAFLEEASIPVGPTKMALRARQSAADALRAALPAPPTEETK